MSLRNLPVAISVDTDEAEADEFSLELVVLGQNARWRLDDLKGPRADARGWEALAGFIQGGRSNVRTGSGP